MKSIRHRILATLIVVGLFPVLVSLIANVTLTKRDTLTAKHQEQRSISAELTRGLHGIMQSVQADLDSIRTNPMLCDTRDTPEIQSRKIEEFRRLKKIYKIFESISLLDINGWELDSTDIDFPGRNDGTKWFRNAMAGEDQITLPEYTGALEPAGPAESGKKGGFVSVNVFKPIRPEGEGDNKVLGVVRGTVRFGKIWELLGGVKMGTGGYVLLVDELGKYLFHPDPDRIFRQVQEDLPITLSSPPSGEMTVKGVRYIYDIKEMPPSETLLSQSWHLISILPYEEAVAIATQSAVYQAIIAVLAMILGPVLGILLSRQLTRHISEAAVAASKVAEGDLETRLPESGPSEMVALATSFNDMTREVKLHRNQLEHLVDERTRALGASREESQVLAAQLKAAFEASRSGILLLRRDGYLLAANSVLANTFGIDLVSRIEQICPDLEQDFSKCFADPEQFSKVWKRAAAGSDEIIDMEFELVLPEPRTVNLYSAPVVRDGQDPVARIWNFRDITQTRSLEMGLRQAQKMEAVGRLAGGVAHDFNNLLQGILGNLALIEQEPAAVTGPATMERIAYARQAGHRAAQIVRQLLGFSRLSRLQLKQCDINIVIQELHNIIRSTFDPRLVVTADLAEECWTVQADATQIEQVVMNMLVNSRDAMDGKGTIRISTRNIALTETQAAAMHEGRAGDFVMISIADNGAGMPPEVMSKIFEPFFTTKEQGKGTGLGLATSFGIVQQHGGWISCESAPGQGTTFRIYLARCLRRQEERTQPVGLPAGPVRGGGETILLVDDEAVVRAVAQGLLGKLGYRVVTAEDGEQALEILRERAGEIDLCLLDLTMPRLSGRDTFAVMRQGSNRDIPVVICSGYLVDLDGFAEEAGSRPEAFVQKPYDLDHLAQTIRSVLDSSGALVA